MTVTLTQAASTYLDDIADSVGRTYVEQKGVDLLVKHIGMLPEDAEEVVKAWLKKREAQA